MSGAAKSFLPLEPINITDAPLDRLQMLESAQAGHDFLVSIYAKNAEDAPKLTQLKQALNPNKYNSFIEQDSQGRETLRLHYVGQETGVAQGFAKLGAVGGAIHAAESIANPVVDLAHKIEDFTKYATQEPARLLSALYFLGDVLYANAGAGDSLEAKLMNASGKMAIAQSAIYMAFARDGSEFEIDALQKRMNIAIAEGKNTNAELWIAPDDKHGVIDEVIRAVRKDPIELGAFVQMGGQTLLAASGAVSVANGNKDGMWDIARAATSITAWAMMQLDEQHVEQKTEWLKNPIARALEEMQDSPHKYASTVNTAASLFGIKSSLNKIKTADIQIAGVDAKLSKVDGSDNFEEWNQLNIAKTDLLAKRPNNRQIAAEVTYLSGDLTMFFARKSEYGGEAATNTKGASKAAAHFIEQSELLMSETPLKQFVGNLSNYLAGRIVHEQLRDGKIYEDMVQAKTEAISVELKQNIFTELNEKQNRYAKAANIVARISDAYPASQQPQIEAALIARLSGLTGADIDVSEMQQKVSQQHGNFAGAQHECPESMDKITPLIIELTELLPSINAAYNADSLYQTMLYFSKPQPKIATATLQPKAKEAAIKEDLIMQR